MPTTMTDTAAFAPADPHGTVDNKKEHWFVSRKLQGNL